MQTERKHMTAREQAEKGLSLLKEAILAFAASHPEGIANAQVAVELGLESDFEGNQQNYLSWSVIGLLVNEGKLRYEIRGRSRTYFEVI
jgi:uncharacterized protein